MSKVAKKRPYFLPLASEREHHTSSSSFLMMSVRPSMIASRMCLVASSNILTCSGSSWIEAVWWGCWGRFSSSLHEKSLRTRQQSCVDRFSCELQRCGLPCLLLLLLPCASVPAQHSEYELQKLIWSWCKFLTMSTEFDKNFSKWSLYSSDHKNDIENCFEPFSVEVIRPTKITI